MGTMLTSEQANLAAEVRATEEGHHAWITSGAMRVISDTTPGLWWNVTAAATHPGAGIVFHCCAENGDPTVGHGNRWSRRPGRVTCKHAALSARRLEREGLAVWCHGLWIATEKAAVVGPVVGPVDPFERL